MPERDLDMTTLGTLLELIQFVQMMLTMIIDDDVNAISSNSNLEEKSQSNKVVPEDFNLSTTGSTRISPI